ncbi:ankyrin repeat and IBR domain-containing protein 1-like [Pollicipes pollicipes]|uniref:ankyrin repeat and IBR domain-containing protein 1-like n=1 Tax=Pollicipes pollicipes TaxID=41117 RepID=UPI001884D158|nr:ankyrin repeat and IBR domain-containing protein 1-like [Pollicipes pollicipes]
MGSTSSKFKKYLLHGDEFAAMQIFQGSPDLRKSLDPNISYGESHNLNTPLHYAAAHNMKHLLRTFLNDLGGNPNKRNGSNETSLHSACRSGHHRSLSAQERRAACVLMLLQWRGPQPDDGDQQEKLDVDALDKDGNTALHLAASCGLKKCVEMLVAHGACLFLENAAGQTSLDLTVANAHHVIALFLESKMVFADPSDSINEADGLLPPAPADQADAGDDGELYAGLRAQDLQEAKDQLLVETADMLHVPLFIADALLRDNDWSKTQLLERWMTSRLECCESAGVQVPVAAAGAGGSGGGGGAVVSPLDQKLICADQHDAGRIVCDICCEEYPPVETQASTACQHRFCVRCWEAYLGVRIRGGDAHHILCPAHGCNFLVPLELIEKLVSRELASRYLQFDIKAFVETNRTIQWCPVAGCGRAVSFPEAERARARPAPQLVPPGPPPPTISHAVDCGAGHFFCWECLGEPHAPVGCGRWAEWQQKVAEVRPDQLRATWADTEDAANALWLVTNSKPCPNCRSPIQKNEGCNHMRCSKCKHDFCWMCLEGWKKHSSATGGYFRCNKLDSQNKADGRHDVKLAEAQMRNKQMQELARFVQMYDKYRRHRDRRLAERPLLGSAAEKMKTLANSSTAAQKGIELEALRFVDQSLRELLKARLLLSGSYVFAYFMDDTNSYSKNIFEFMQSELEQATESLATMAALPYLKTPMPTIVATTQLVKRKRDEFMQACERGLVPPETPPGLRTRWGRHLPVSYSSASQLPAHVVATLSELDPAASWSRDVQANLSAMYDWPDVDWEDDEDDEDDSLTALAARLLSQCRRQGCARPRARNPRTGATHDYCSLKCSRMDMLGDLMDQGGALTGGYNMELRIALEMSRLQQLEEQNLAKQRGLGQSVGATWSAAADGERPDRLGEVGGRALRRCQSLGELHRQQPPAEPLLLSSDQSGDERSGPTTDSADREVSAILDGRPAAATATATAAVAVAVPPPRHISSRLSGHLADDESASSASDVRGRMHIVVQRPALETESSADCESETGIPRSPTLYISGVSISRSPEAAAAALSLHLAPVSSPPPHLQLRASKSASDAEKRRDVFQFPVSPSEAQLSCVLHVEESTLSSDDFHEALFLEKSPKCRRKRSKRERLRDRKAAV